MLNTPLTELRPRRMTHAALVEYFAKHGLPRKIGSFGAFERGQIKSPPEAFVRLWAAAVGSTVAEVRDALLRTQRMRSRGTGPFKPSRRVPRRVA